MRVAFLERNFYDFRARIYLQQGIIFKNQKICGRTERTAYQLSFIQICLHQHDLMENLFL